ncbi:unnamed protein product [Rotaria sp. Silwood2]|nr:unnamed protein product [Rotaria sp. Silwood2]
MTDKQRFPNDQEHWWCELSPKQVSRPLDVVSSLPKQQQQPQLAATKQKKKKSRGNRAEQHFHRRLRNRNLDDETRTFLVQVRAERKREQQEQKNIYNTTTEVNKISNQISKMAEDIQIMIALIKIYRQAIADEQKTLEEMEVL